MHLRQPILPLLPAKLYSSGGIPQHCSRSLMPSMLPPSNRNRGLRSYRAAASAAFIAILPPLPP